MSFDYSKLKGKIIENYCTQSLFAKKMGWSTQTMTKKISNKVEWKQSEISKAIELLNLQENDICTYFFTSKVQNIELRKRNL